MYKSIEKICEQCNKSFLGAKNRKYCGYKCSKLSRKRRINLICQEWSKNTKFCSFSCKVKAQSSKIIEVLCTNCSNSFLRKEHKCTRNKSGNVFCSKNCANIFNCGKNHYEWKDNLHDKHFKLALKQWGIKIKERDGYTCQLCSNNNRNILEAHHIKQKSKFPELQFDFSNGITLCIYCHALQHTNNSRSLQLITYKIKKYENNK